MCIRDSHATDALDVGLSATRWRRQCVLAAGDDFPIGFRVVDAAIAYHDLRITIDDRPPLVRREEIERVRLRVEERGVSLIARDGIPAVSYTHLTLPTSD